MLKAMALRCLIVDDNSDFLETARQLLQRGGLDVVGAATTGAQAVARAAELRPDVILLDVYLGGESGFTVARELAKVGGPAGPAIILISTYAERDLVDQIDASPAVAFLSKDELSVSSVKSALGLEDD
jgi:two-component system, NarL family, nitrate/nitrite response regulator NarL